MQTLVLRGDWLVRRKCNIQWHVLKFYVLYFLIAPAPKADPNTPKDSSLCIIPECAAKKYSDSNGVTHPFCGKTHADLGKKRNIQRE